MAHQAIEMMKEKMASMAVPSQENGYPSARDRTSYVGDSPNTLIAKYDIDEKNLGIRRAFIRLGEEDRTLCIELIPWIEEHSARIVREFYDWQFNFPKTVAFFEHMAKEKGMTLVQLRVHLEKAQQGYLESCFSGAHENWGINYFGGRLHIGAVHNDINLPFKWFIGSYTEFQTIIHKQLKASFEDRDYVDRAFKAINKVFNFDMQAICEATIFSAIEGFGFPFESITTDASSDRSEHLDQISNYLVERELENADYRGQMEAIRESQAVIEFDPDGTIRTANVHFLNATGYRLEEIVGQHHRIFMDPDEAASPEYRRFWDTLGRGENHFGEFKRVTKQGEELWIQASYNPLKDDQGQVFKVVKYAIDITEQKQRNLDSQGQLEAIRKSQAVIEFDTDGTIRTANDHFLRATGYTLDEIAGRHHRIFMDPADAEKPEYLAFWSALARGEGQIGEFRRHTKQGKELWLQASYNPILDDKGKPFKVVKYASDITEAVQTKIRLQESVAIMMDVVRAASQGDLTQNIDIEGDDAIGQMAEGLRGFLVNLREIISKLDDNAQMLAAAAEELSTVSDNMENTAGETSQQANTVASAAEEISTNIQTVAAGAEEMTASIKEVATNASEAARVASEAVNAAEKTNTTVSKLGESSAEIGNVIKVITSIAQQTNLLALNATIEAARAGEAGKGFAVVANEVKELAKQTAQATEEISQKIEAIQTDTQGAVQAISQIGSIIGQINDIQGTIATAVEEQTSTTSEIARNVHEAAKGSSEIAENISKVAHAADNTSAGARESQTATEELSKMSNTLKGIVSQFTY